VASGAAKAGTAAGMTATTTAIEITTGIAKLASMAKALASARVFLFRKSFAFAAGLVPFLSCVESKRSV